MNLSFEIHYLPLLVLECLKNLFVFQRCEKSVSWLFGGGNSVQWPIDPTQIFKMGLDHLKWKKK